MKKILRDKILNIEGTNVLDNTFLFEYLENLTSNTLENAYPGLLENSHPNFLENPHPNLLLKEKELTTESIGIIENYSGVPGYVLEISRELRKDQTPSEKILWEILRGRRFYNMKFRRQYAFGRYIADFYCHEHKVVIELDGKIHEKNKEYDAIRDEIIQQYGVEILRFSNDELIDDFEGVCKKILQKTPLSFRRGVGGEDLKEEEIQGGGGEESKKDIQIIYLKDLLENRKNFEILKKVSEKPAMYSEVYSPKDELEIFTRLFEDALKDQKKIHIVGITLKEEIQILEEYYEELGFLREDINAFDIDFSIPLVTVSCHIENLMWRGSDYKAQKDAIFFCPPIRESGQNKALFKGITRGVIAGIELGEFTPEKREFIGDCIRGEKILPLHMGKVLKYNIEQVGIKGDTGELEINY